MEAWISSTGVTLEFFAAEPFGTKPEWSTCVRSCRSKYSSVPACYWLRRQHWTRSLARALIPYFALPLLIGIVATGVGLLRNSAVAAPKKDSTGQSVGGHRFGIGRSLPGGAVPCVRAGPGLGQPWPSCFGSNSGFDGRRCAHHFDGARRSWSPVGSCGTRDCIGILSNTALKTALALTLGRSHFRWLAAAELGLIATGLALSLVFVAGLA